MQSAFACEWQGGHDMSNLSPKAKKRRRLRSLRNALAILLTFAMVWQMSPFALADDVMLNADGAAATQTDDDAAAAEAEAEAAAAAQAEAEAQAQAEAEAAAAAQAEAEAQAQAEAEARAQAEAEAAAAAQAEAEAQTEAEEEPEAPVEEPANEEPLAAQDAAEQEAPVSTDDETTIVADVETETIAEEAADSIVTSGEEPEADADDEEKDDEEKDDEDEEEPAKKRVYTYSDGSVSVTATVATPEAVPDDAYLVVRALTPGSAGYYSYLSTLDATYGDEHDASNTLLYDVYFEQVTEDGQIVEVHPTEGSVYVQFRFTQAQLSQGIEAETPADVEVTHLPDGGGAEPLAASVGTDSASFTTPSFSVFAFSYTVDFTYDGYTYCFPGEGRYVLADVLAALGIYDAIDSATLTLIDGIAIDGDLYLTQESGVWYISSDVPFTSTYELAVVCGNTTYLIMATDNVEESSALANFLTNAVITGATQNADGAYQVVAGQKYTVALTFTEDSDYQFANRSSLTYQMPAGITVPELEEGPFPIKVRYRGVTYEVPASYTLTTDGLLTVEFDETDPNFGKLESATNVSFRFSYEAMFDSEVTEIKFSDDVTRTIVFEDPEPGNAYVNKTGTFDASTGMFHYTITVTADGDVTDVRVKDVITGNALIFNNDVAVSGNSSSYTDNGATNGFDYTFGSMDEGETITITYTASVDFSKDTDNDGKITVDQTKNTVTVTPEDGDPHQSEYSHEIVYKSTNKSDGTEAGTDADGNKILNWTITYNELALVAVGGDTITDTIADTSQQYMEYYGDGIAVHVYDKNNVEIGDSPRNVSWDALTNYSDSTWTYTIPDTDTTPYKYVIEYKTKVDKNKVDAASATVVLNNNANGDWGGYNATPEGLPSIKKAVESSSTTEVTWVATIEVPKKGLSRAVVTDTLPARLINAQSKWYYDLFKDGTLEITGLLEGESYRAQTTGFTDGSKDNSKVVITFYQDEDKTVPGLKSSEEGHTITVKLTSTVDQDWLQYGYGVTDSGQLYLKQHTNTIDINGIQDTATVTYDKLGIEKTGEAQTDANGKVIGLKYTLLIKGVTSSPIIVNDEFDTSLLEVDTSKATQWDHMRIWGGGQWSQSNGRYSVSYTDTDSGITLTANSVPVDSDNNGNYYSHYKIVYYLKLKDGVDLDALAKANGGKYDLTNKAKWGDHESDFTYTTEYDFLDKELLNAGAVVDDNRVAQYRITFNKAKATLNDGEPMTMTDVLSANLSLDYSSVSIVTDPAGQQVSYVAAGGDNDTTVVTYTVPDETKVTITYSALVTGTGEQTINNVVTVKGKSEEVVDKESYVPDASGEAGLVSFKIVKVDGYDATKKLEGAKFKIYCENENVNFGPNANNAKELILETDEKGEIILDGDVTEGGYTFWLYDAETSPTNIYHIKEIEAPDTYASINIDYIVKLTNDMDKIDYGKRIYYFDGDSMQIKNWPLEGLVVEKQVEGEVSDEDADKEFTFKISILNADESVNADFDSKIGSDQFTDGVFTFKLKAGQQHSFQGFAEGTKYKVEEILTDEEGNEYTTTVEYGVLDADGNLVSPTEDPAGTSHRGTTSTDDQMVRFTNKKTEQTGSLKLKKVVTVNGAATTGTLANGDYTFTVVGPASAAGADQVTKTVVITIENGVMKSATIDDAAATIGSDGYIEVTGLAAGDYTITETAPTNGTSLTAATGGKSVSDDKVVTVTVVAGQTADAVVDAGKASFTNNYETVNLGVTKAWSPVSAAQDSVTLTLYKGYSEADAATEVDTIVLDGTIDTSTANVSGVTGATKQEDSAWHAQFSGLPKYEYVAGTDGAAGTLKQVYYVVKEANANVPSGFAVSYTTSSGETATYAVDGGTVTNTQQEGALKLTKLVTVNGAAPTTDADKALVNGVYTFTVTGPGEATTVNKTVKITVTNGVAASATVDGDTATLDSDGYVVISGLTPGEYTITETAPTNGTTLSMINGADATGNSTTVTVTAGDTTAANASASFTNNINVGSLTITKTFAGNTDKLTDADKAKVSFTVSGPQWTEAQTLSYADMVDGVKTYENIELGDYTVTESTGDGKTYTTTYKVGSDGTETTGTTATATVGASGTTVAFTNTYQETAITLDAEKIIDVKEGVTAPDETFTFTLSAGKVIKAGETSVPMPSDTAASITGAGKVSTGEDPFGAITYTKPGVYTYTITETAGSGAGWTYNVNGAVTATVTVTADATTGALSASAEYSKGTDAAEITNKYEVGSLKISKTLSGNATDANKVFHFTITVEGASGAYTASGTMRSVSFDANGKAEVTLKGGENVTIKGLPVGAAYTVTETEANQDGYTTVGANTSGTIPADSAANATPEAKFTNTKNLGGLTITKTFAGITDKLTDEDKAKISFTVSGPQWDEAQTFTYADMENGVKVYEDIELGEYTVTESTGEGKAYTTTYKVGANGTKTEGTTATATVGTSGTTVAFTNTYQETTATPEVTKEFSDWGKAESFTFTLAAVGDAPMPAAGSEVATATETAKTAKFGEITYTKAGIYEYTITETNDGVDGVTYDTTAHPVTVTVEENAETKALSATVKYGDADSLTVTNTFTPITATPEVTKAFNDWGKVESFTFTLAAVGDAPMPAAGGEVATATEAAPLAKFGEITYEKAGTYEYTITETAGEVDGVSYDITAHKVIVTVSKDSDTNALSAKVTYDDADSLTVTNTFTPAKATPEVTKAINVWCEGDEFAFTLAAVGDAPMPAAGGEVATATEAAPLAKFGEITYDKAGTYEYTITETNGGADGVAYDITAHKVTVTVTKADDETNALSAEVTYDGADSLTVTNEFTPAKATPEVTKAINVWCEGDEFAFTLAPVTEGAPMPAKGGETATATEDAPLAKFGEIEFTEAGTYEYTITETNGGADGVAYDITAHKVVVTVTKADDETNALTAEVTYDGADSLTVTNTFTPVKAAPEVTKAINMWPEGEEFSFTLAAVGDAPMPAKGGETATATADAPLAKFGEIEFTAAGTYEYTITETAGEAGGVTYDTTAHKVTITVTKADDETNALSAKVTYDGADSLTVTNTYDAKGSFTITGVRKTLKNGTLKAGQFKFQVVNAAGNVVATGTNDASGAISFGETALTLDDLGGAESKDLTYTVREVIPAGATRTSQGYLYNGVYYANQTMTVTVTVTDKGDGTLDVKQATDGKVGVAFTFVNTTTPPIVPHTGDPTSFAALYALATAGLSSIAGGLHMRRRRRREDDGE